MIDQRVTVLTGHYGSGKTSVALALALHMRGMGRRVAIGDLDIVNPYFRTADCREELAAAGVPLIASPYAGSNLDVPALPKELYALLTDKASYAVLDVGGDDRGAVALGRYAPMLVDRAEVLFTVNFFRPLTRTPEAALAVLREVETACGLACTGLVHNSNLGPATEPGDLMAARPLINALSSLSGLPVRLTTANPPVYRALEHTIENLMEIHPLSTGIAE